MLHRLRHPRALLLAALLGSIVTASLSTPGAFAAYVVCRTDPVATLSNGAQITMAAQVSDTASDIKSVSYQLHIPTGLKVTAVTFDSVYGSLEQFSWYADQKARIYRDDTLVTTASNGIQIQATASVARISCNQPAKWQNGSAGKTVVVPFSC